MPTLPTQEHLDLIDAQCLFCFRAGAPDSALAIAELLMDLPELPMHCPYHHYLTAAALLTAAQLRSGGSEAQLLGQLKKARERAASIPGGYCGQFGCCGAAISAGIFACVWQNSTPQSKKGWAANNEITARALSAIASTEGPRCCKRVTYLALSAAIPAARELLGVDVGDFPGVLCHHFKDNRECLGKSCPFFPVQK